MFSLFLKKVLPGLFFLLILNPALNAGLSVQPGIVELLIPAGEPYSGTYRVSNSSQEEIRVKVESENWLKRRNPENSNAQIPLSSWLTITPDSFAIEPGQVKEVKYLVELPETLKGEVVAMNFFVPEVPEGGIRVRRRFGSALYAAEEKSAEIFCKITETEISENSVYITVKNTGNVHIRPEGKIILVGTDQELNKEISLRRGAPVFPGKEHKIRSGGGPGLLKSLPPGKYMAQPLITYGEAHGKEFSLKGEAVEIHID